MDKKLLDILVCPICKGPLLYLKSRQELICKADRLAFPVKDGIPVPPMDVLCKNLSAWARPPAGTRSASKCD